MKPSRPPFKGKPILVAGTWCLAVAATRPLLGCFDWIFFAGLAVAAFNYAVAGFLWWKHR